MDLTWIDYLYASAPSWFQELLSLWVPQSGEGLVVHESGAVTVLKRRRPELGTEHWLHTLYPGLTQSTLINLEVDFGLRFLQPEVLLDGVGKVTGYRGPTPSIPPAYKEFLGLCNGARLYGGHLNLFGVRKSADRDATRNRQPYGIADENLFRRPPMIESDLFIFGGYPYTGSYLCMRASDDAVLMLDRSGGNLLRVWPTLENMLVTESNRLAVRFDEHGTLINPEVSTAPDSAVLGCFRE